MKQSQAEPPYIKWGNDSGECSPTESARLREDDFHTELMNLKKSKSRERMHLNKNQDKHQAAPQGIYKRPNVISNQ